MKKLYTTIAMLFIGNIISFAQPVLNASDFSATANYGFNAYEASNVSGLSSGGEGIDQTWDFSGITGMTSAGTLSIVPVASTPYTSIFPTANFTAKEIGSGDPTYIYYKVSSTEIETVGESDGGTLDPETDHSIFFKFPYTYGLIFDDTYQYQSGTSPGSYTATYDAYGTLITPYATYGNVIRQKKIEVEGATTYTSYLWLTANPFTPIMSMSFVNDGTTTSNSIRIYADPSLKVNGNNKENLAAVYPNPATSIVNLDFSTTLTIDKVIVVDVTGRVVLQQEGSATQINVEKLAAGLYVIEAYSGAEKFTSKFVKK